LYFQEKNALNILTKNERDKRLLDTTFTSYLGLLASLVHGLVIWLGTAMKQSANQALEVVPANPNHVSTLPLINPMLK
jgi:hypothetical protein